MTLYSLNTQKVGLLGALVGVLGAILTPPLTLLSRPDFIGKIYGHDPSAWFTLVASCFAGVLAALGTLLALVGRTPAVKDDQPGVLVNPTAAPPKAGAKGK